jgi:hypothetical protein
MSTNEALPEPADAETRILALLTYRRGFAHPGASLAIGDRRGQGAVSVCHHDPKDHGPPAVELPIACTLPGDGAARVRRWQGLAARGCAVARLSGHVLEVRYSLQPGVRGELEELAAAERLCCSFVTWTVSQDGDHVMLRVAADPERPDDVADIASLFGAT